MKQPIRVYPVRFNPQMIKSLELRSKLQTRRVVKAGNSIVFPGHFEFVRLETGRRKVVGGENVIRARCDFVAGPRVVSVRSKVQPLDLLWVRRGQKGGTRAASTMTLEVWSVECSRLQDLTAEDAIAEGIWHPRAEDGLDIPTHLLEDFWLPCAKRGLVHLSPRLAFRDLWESINGRGSWDANPWVWTYQFVVHSLNIDVLLDARRHVAEVP